MTNVSTVLARAMRMLGRRTVYWAGTGGFDPLAPSPTQPLAIGRKWPGLSAEEQAELRPTAEAAGLDVDDPLLVAPACDCSGFVCWALGIDRNPGPGRWINTDSIWADAKGRATQFREIERAVPGCLVVYPKEGSHETYGHVALVTEVAADGTAARIVHCSAKNFAAAPADAIKITDARVFKDQDQSIYAWFKPMSA